ncbi:hypothetical protein J3A78_003860 [Streptomyces sp. PvR006]|uniref:hypothetical protein n=1 Tax=Streptomyces sp. PvR006 TaxID=2817860 RepID=UPI001AEB7E44|nr:hypothetical protein [Streptomyces sp. PvR006]MBP2583382.1 hypothetical protein [Streptomyces sp. PvR006]
MSDYQDEIMGRIARDLSLTYTILVKACANLPLPITLPTGEISNLDAVPAVRRVSEIVEDIPMPQDAQAALFASCCFWLASMDLYGLLCQDFHQARAHSALATLIVTTDSLAELGDWLLGNTDA